jgi:hypothetical protein
VNPALFLRHQSPCILRRCTAELSLFSGVASALSDRVCNPLFVSPCFFDQDLCLQHCQHRVVRLRPLLPGAGHFFEVILGTQA